MSRESSIEWTESTWNPITGCSVYSAGCTNCYAMKLAGTRLRDHPTRAGLTKPSAAGPVWTGELRFNPGWLDQPLRWKAPRRIFVCAHSDLFHEQAREDWIDLVFAVMAGAQQHTFQVLTKRASRMRIYLDDIDRARRIRAVAERFGLKLPAVELPLRNVWLGVSIENQAAADERLRTLAVTPAALRWVSFEPLIGPVSLPTWFTAVRFYWAVVGGESGAGARPMHPDWARAIRDVCVPRRIPFFFKQWGTWQSVYDRDKDDPDWRRAAAVERDHPGGRWLNVAGEHGFHGDRVHYVVPAGKAKSGRLLDGREWNKYPTGPRERFELLPR